MDVNLQCAISNEDLVSILRTILIFLETLEFKNASDAFKNECLSKGYNVETTDPAKLLLLSSDESPLDNRCFDSCLLGTMLLENFPSYKITKCTCAQTSATRENLKKAFSRKHNKDEYVSPATMESEQPTKILSKSNINKIYKNLKNEEKALSRPRAAQSLKSITKKFISYENEEKRDHDKLLEEKDANLSHKFQELQDEHKKLMGVTAELTEALQTQILGQPQNLNDTLSSCQNIFPDLFEYKINKDDKKCESIENLSYDNQVHVGTSTNDMYSDVGEPVTLMVNVVSKTTNKNISETMISDRGKETFSSVTKITTETHYGVPNSKSSEKSIIKKNTSYYNTDKDIDDEICSHKTITIFENAETDSVNDDIQKSENLKDSKLCECETINCCSRANENQKSSRCISKKLSDLDFKKIKKDLHDGDDNTKLLLLQALRWRITQNDNAIRYQIINTYIRHDLLELLNRSSPSEKSAAHLYLCPENKRTPNILQEQMARLLNTFASLTLGRDYLCQDDVVSLLVYLIIDNHSSQAKIDSKTRDMLIATLQKLSLRNQQRMLMISSGLLEYLVLFLKTQHNNITRYCMEYSTALFMNLCLHTEARQRLVSQASQVIGLLTELLDSKYYYCMPYVNGAVYGLLLNPQINREAQRVNFSKVLEHHIQNTEGEMRRQLQVILNLQTDRSLEDDCDCDPVESDTEGDYIEPELDSEDTLKLQPSGEDFLKRYKLLFSAYGSQVYAVRLECMCQPQDTKSEKKEKNLKICSSNNNSVKIISDENRQNEKDEIENKSKKSATSLRKIKIIDDNKNTQTTKIKSKESVRYLEDIRSLDGNHKSTEIIRNKSSEIIQKPNESTTAEKIECTVNKKSSQNLTQKPSSNTDLDNLKSEKGKHKKIETLYNSSATSNTKLNQKTTQDLEKVKNSESETSLRDIYSCEEVADLHSVKELSNILEPSKSQEKVKAFKFKLNEQSSKVSKQEMSYSEVSKQFYPVPSAKTGIFQSKRYQKSHKIPPSFTRTIPLQQKIEMKCINPECTYCYHQNMSEIRSDNTNLENRFSTCYRESYNKFTSQSFTPNANYKCKPGCVCCNTRRKYSCNCYNVIKKSLNDNSTSTDEDSGDKYQPALVNFECNCVEPPSEPLKILVNTNETNDQQVAQDDESNVYKLSCSEPLTNLCSEEKFHECPNSKVNYHCYDEVFLSRPKILRTPP